jgi:translation elongation factor EF-1beta
MKNQIKNIHEKENSNLTETIVKLIAFGMIAIYLISVCYFGNLF